MADYINISEIDRFDTRWDERVAFDKIKVELDIMTKRFEQAESHLSAIFTRIGRGDEVQLHYRDGEVVRIGRLDAEPKDDVSDRA
jgi:hypothetical protein